MNEEQLQQQIVALVQAALQGDEQANQQIEQIMQAAQQGNQQAMQIAQMIQMVAEQMQGGGGQMMNQAQPTSMARNGAKLEYINRLRGKCPEGYEVTYFKKGGNLCKACQKKKQKMAMGSTMPEPTDAVEAFKCGRKMKKKKCETGASIEMDKCGGKPKQKKAACGTKLDSRKGGGGMNGAPYTRKQQDEYNWTDTKKDAQGRTSVRTVTEDGTWYTGRNGKSGMEGTAVGDSIKNADWRRGEPLRKPIKKKEFGGPFVPFTSRGLR